ncbi:MAG: hypothetical protein IJD80_00130 [Oscillospiraceae bacterium]|nr:hypothetical protein [Oscillospiraceae bacterium]
MDKRALKHAFTQTIPIMVSYLFIGIAFGILLSEAGYGFEWAIAMALIVYAAGTGSF